MRLPFFFALLLPLYAQDPVEILRKSLDRDARNSELRKNYTYIARQEERELDGKGKTVKTESRTHEILILGGRSYERLIAKDDKPLSESEQRKEQQKMDRELAKRLKESPGERKKIEKEREDDRKFLKEVVTVYDLRLVGTETVSGKPAWVITADPKPGAKPSSRAKILTKIKAKIWVDQQEYQWVKVDAEAIDTLSLALALLRIAPGGKLHFEQTRVNDEVWLPSFFSARADARVGYIKKLHGEITQTFRDYRKFQTDSKIVSVEEQK